jgi:hypothetical protein
MYNICIECIKIIIATPSIIIIIITTIIYFSLSESAKAGAFFRSLYLFSLLKFVGYKHTLSELLFRQPFRAPFLLCEKISSNGLLSGKKKKDTPFIF